MLILINGLAFYFFWFALMTGAAYEETLLPNLGLLTYLLLHLYLCESPKKELKLFAVVLVIGFVVESIFINSGLLSYKQSLGPFPPLWLLGLYLFFASSIDHSLFWIQKAPWAFSPLVAFGSCSGYLLANFLGAADLLQDEGITLTILGIYWMVMPPLLLKFKKAYF